MSTLATADSMMSIATTEAFAAGLVLPPAMMVNFQFKLCQGNPVNLDKAGQEWRKAAEQIQQTGTALREAVSAISTQDWSAQDRKAYEQKVEQCCSQLEVAHTFCLAIGIALTALAYALFVYAIFAVAMGTFLGALAVTAAAALAAVITAGIYATCLSAAATSLTVTSVATGILAAAGQMAAAVMAGGSMVSAIVEKSRGNEQALNDFFQAQATGSAGAVANLTQNAANAGLSWVNRSGGVNIAGGGKGSPLSAVDLDADRDSDRTWNIGGGATFASPGGSEHEVGTHVKYGDRGWQGVEGEYKYTSPTDWSVGGKAGWEEDGDGKDSIYGGINTGYENSATNAGVNAEAEGKYNLDTGAWEAKGGGGVTYQGGDVYKDSHEVKADGQGDYSYKQETQSWLGDSESETPPWDR